MNTYLRHRHKFKQGKGARQLTDVLVEASMLTQQRCSLQQLQDSQLTWESKEIRAALDGQGRLSKCPNITALIAKAEAQGVQQNRAQYGDRGQANFRTTYTDEQSLNVAKVPAGDV